MQMRIKLHGSEVWKAPKAPGVALYAFLWHVTQLLALPWLVARETKERLGHQDQDQDQAEDLRLKVPPTGCNWHANVRHRLKFYYTPCCKRLPWHARAINQAEFTGKAKENCQLTGGGGLEGVRQWFPLSAPSAPSAPPHPADSQRNATARSCSKHIKCGI